MAVDVWNLAVGARVSLEDGVVAEVVSPTEDGNWIKVRYVEVPESPELVGTEDLCDADEILGAA